MKLLDSRGVVKHAGQYRCITGMWSEETERTE